MGGRTLDQFRAKQKSKAQKDSRTGTISNQEPDNTNKREHKNDL